ncbi:hypothetical protein MQE36_14460 [Zhouia spongiae]|uniref:Uncharacterized protein n=1 Tax=Zhouia spongiae TaxID=2202721 RepID=A0ABY3YKB2_9FLAO|nr:hypothetical protein [Zhouia spongiae]UNY98281.1 hypothetical protein MQE36_14460 [Zhouia spongiae]
MKFKLLLFLILPIITISQTRQDTIKYIRDLKEISSINGKEISEILTDLKKENSKAGTTREYRAQVISTNFTVPMVRFNFIDSTTDETKGNVTFFNSIGAGINYSFMGRLSETRNEYSEVINREHHNIIGVQAGFLFSAKTGDAPTNIFALTAGLNILDFQIGYGYELGTIEPNQKRGFITIAYSIPISKLMDGGFFILNQKNLKQEDVKKATQK